MVQRNRDVSSAADAVDRALLNLTKIAPTTVAGAAALLIYFAELELEGVGWWQMHEDDRCYSHHLARHVAARIARAGGMTAKRRATMGVIALSLMIPHVFACADEMKIGSWLFQQIHGANSSELNWELTAKHPGDGAPDPPADFGIECRGNAYSFYLTIWGDSGTSLQSLPLNVTIDGKEHFTLNVERKDEIAAPFKATLPSDVLAAFGRATHNITFAYSGHLPIRFDAFDAGKAIKMLRTTCSAAPAAARQVP